jgi:hypothetical protein
VIHVVPAGSGMWDRYTCMHLGCGIRDAGSGMRDPGCGIRDAGSGMRDRYICMHPGCGMRDAGCGLVKHVDLARGGNAQTLANA